MSTNCTVPENTKNLWCRDARVQNIIQILGKNPFKQGRGFHIRECNKGNECLGAHIRDDIRPYPHVNKWERTDKSTFNFPQMYNVMIEVITKDKTKMKDYSQFKTRIDKLNELNFIELLQLWRELSCYYRKISKELPRKNSWQSSELPKAHSTGYIFSSDVPGFYIEDSKLEDNLWAFERITRKCKTQENFINSINKKELITIWDICLGDKNCKEGFHYTDESLCNDDFLEGKCSCINRKDFDSKVIELIEKIKNIKEQILNPATRPKRIEQLKIILNDSEISLRNSQRKIHYTESGMLPFKQQMENYKNVVIEEEKVKIQKEETREKPNWDHSLQKADKPIGKVVKISIKKN